MRINHNIAALNTHRQLNSANNAQQNSMEKLSSGLRINSAKDDAAGLVISEKMRAQVRGLDQSSANAQDANSLIQTAEGALNETQDILQRMRELAVQAGNDTNTTTDREEIQKEVNQLTSEINRIGNTTEFNTQKLLNGGKVEGGGDGAVKATATLGDLTVTAKEPGAAGNDASIEIITPTSDSDFGVSVTNNKITVTLAYSGGSVTAATNDEIANAINADADASKLVSVSVASGQGSATVNTGQAETNLSSGQDGDGEALQFQIGANENQSLTLEISDMRANALGLTTTGADTKFGVTNGTDNEIQEQALDVTSHEGAAQAITTIQKAIDGVSAERSKLGATQNRLDHSINNLNTSSENLTAAESRIRDVDMAKEMMNQTKQSILSQASQAMLAKANQQPQGVLQLLR
ncbi:flagellin N-terminal helical domain-containing protein [Salimicrobium album]|uniref:Flagellin n=1 Tax=Salimicrobium album TaxID=50717 RepID=A0A1H3G3I0_9BACI|nr:flagellin [Salimicrobium album]SDX97577.1 flagellin [Salimicrobium album]